LDVVRQILERCDDELIVMAGHGLFALMNQFRNLVIKTLPEHCHSNYIIFLNPKVLRHESKNLGQQATKNMKSGDSKRQFLGVNQEVMSLYLFTHSWDSARAPDPRNANSPAFVRIRVEEICEKLLAKIGKEIP
jgi:hypothetical protein